MLTESHAEVWDAARKPSGKTKTPMGIKPLRILPVALCAAVLAFAPLAAQAQSGGQKPTTGSAEPNKDGQKRSDEVSEAGRVITGPAGNPECVWLGRRVVGLLYNDDLDTAFRHLDLYDRFGCPGPHIQQAFRCAVRLGSGEAAKVHRCWLNPVTTQPEAASVAAPGSPGGAAR
jgi:hypothetical protein